MSTQLALPLEPRPIGKAPLSARASVYEAGAQTRRTVGWKAPTTSPNNSLLYSLATLRDRSRQAIRNDGWAKGAID